MRPLSELRILIDRIPCAEGNLGEEAILTALLQDLIACASVIFALAAYAGAHRKRHARAISVISDRALRWPLLPMEVSRADLVIWGGGHMLQDRSSRLYIPYVVKILLLAKCWARRDSFMRRGLGRFKLEWRDVVPLALRGALPSPCAMISPPASWNLSDWLDLSIARRIRRWD